MNRITAATLRIHMAIGMMRQKTELFQWLRIYIRKNVYSIISVNCLPDLMLLRYLNDIFCIISVACLSKREQMRF